VSYDLFFNSDSTRSKPFGFGYQSAVGVSGVTKMVNRWTKCLLTRKGSDPFDRNEGTSFVGLAGSNVCDEADVFDMAALAVEDCNTQMRAWDMKSQPPTAERFLSAAITRIVRVEGDRYDIWVTVRNTTGQAATLTLAATGY
jgi:hypothetical protein